MPPPATGWRERLSDMYDRVKGGKFENNEKVGLCASNACGDPHQRESPSAPAVSLLEFAAKLR